MSLLLLLNLSIYPLEKDTILDMNLNKTEGVHLFQQSNSRVVLLAGQAGWETESVAEKDNSKVGCARKGIRLFSSMHGPRSQAKPSP